MPVRAGYGQHAEQARTCSTAKVPSALLSCRIVPRLDSTSMLSSLHIRVFDQTCPLTQDSNILARMHMSHPAQAMSDSGARAKHMTIHDSCCRFHDEAYCTWVPCCGLERTARASGGCRGRLRKSTLCTGGTLLSNRRRCRSCSAAAQNQASACLCATRMPAHQPGLVGAVNASGRATTVGSSTALPPCTLHHGHVPPMQSAPHSTSARLPAHSRCMTHHVGFNKCEHDSSPCLNQGALNVMQLRPAKSTSEPAAKQVGQVLTNGSTRPSAMRPAACSTHHDNVRGQG